MKYIFRSSPPWVPFGSGRSGEHAIHKSNRHSRCTLPVQKCTPCSKTDYCAQVQIFLAPDRVQKGLGGSQGSLVGQVSFQIWPVSRNSSHQKTCGMIAFLLGYSIPGRALLVGLFTPPHTHSTANLFILALSSDHTVTCAVAVRGMIWISMEMGLLRYPARGTVPIPLPICYNSELTPPHH